MGTDRKDGGSIPVMNKKFFSTASSPASYAMGTVDFFSQDKATEA
jgi:hypothetical protein